MSSPTSHNSDLTDDINRMQIGNPEHPEVPSAPSGLNTQGFAFDPGELNANLSACNTLHNSVGTLNPRGPGLHNRSIQLIKKVMRRGLTWYTRPLHEFHGAVTRTLNQLARAQHHSETVLEGLETRVARLEQLTSSSDAHTIHALQRDIRRLQDQLREGQRDLSNAASPPRQETPAVEACSSGAQLDFDYFMFEERFRGPEKEIKFRQREYLDYYRGCTDVLDLGCGRGEFLELMRDNGIPARGVDISTDMLLLCREKGLTVTQSDLLAHLRSLADESLGGAFSSQVIEHMLPAAYLEMLRLLKHKLRTRSPVVIETINPACVSALCHNFYLDPTHVRPVHPETLAFALRSLGFSNVEVKYSSPVIREFPKLQLAQAGAQLEALNQRLTEALQLLFGFQDYAVIGWK